MIFGKRICCLFGIASIFLLTGCSSLNEPTFDYEKIYVSDVYENFEYYKGKTVTIEGYVTFDEHNIYLWESRGRDSLYYIFIEPGKIDWGDKGFKFHEIIVRGEIAGEPCQHPGANIYVCGRYIVVDDILYIE